MRLKEIQMIVSVLSEYVGWSCPIPFFKALARKNTFFGKTHWSNVEGPETEFVKRISIAPALYIELGKSIGRDRSFEVMEELLVSIGCNEQWDHLNSMDASKGAGMERLMAFNNLMDQKGAPRFNTRIYVKQDEKVCHYLITRCVFDDFFAEVGTPELTKSFCEVDHRFFPEAFPDFRFHRGASRENTIAYGKDRCEFVFEKIEISVGY
jgi:hypothetical protein